jgi:hypothetical protein
LQAQSQDKTSVEKEDGEKTAPGLISKEEMQMVRDLYEATPEEGLDRFDNALS